MKQQHDYTVPEQPKQRGQSLVEVALFLPILIIIIAGVVEVSQLLITQNRINSASRAAARFGANGGENEGIRRVILGNVTQTLDLNEALWDIWVMRGQVNDAGNTIEQWEFEHVYGISNTVRFSEVEEDVIRQRVLNQLAESGRSAADLNFVGTYVQHDVDTLLGLDALPWLQGYNSVASLNVMRIIGQTAEVTRGCDAFPLSIEEFNRSATPPGSGGSNAYPTNFTNGSPTPDFYSFTQYAQNPDNYDTPLRQAQPGFIYALRETQDSGGFGYLRWNEKDAGNTNTLTRSLAWPGNSQDYTDHGHPYNNYGIVPGQTFPYPVRGYLEPDDPTDTSMNIGDWVWASTGNMNATHVLDEILAHINKDRYVRVIVFDEKVGTGSNGKYKISGFATFKLHAIFTVGNDKGIVAEFISWDDSCGQN
jgi:hypothetical protein